MSFSPWFEANPGRLQQELDALIAVEVNHTVNEISKRQGILQIELIIKSGNAAFDLPGQEESLKLQVVFPDNYPYFRPDVYAPNLSLPRHQDPFHKNLCLLQQPTSNWSPEWTLVKYLQEQLPKVLEKGRVEDQAAVAADRDERAEPISVYYADTSLPVIFDSSWADLVPVQDEEIALLGKAQVGLPVDTTFPMRMAVLETHVNSGESVGAIPKILHDDYPQTIDGVIIRLKQNPPSGDANKSLLWLKELASKYRVDLSSKGHVNLQSGVRLTGFIGLNFPEEVEPGKMGMGWLFLITLSIKEKYPLPTKKAQYYDRLAAFYAKPLRAGKKDLQVRVPKLAGLKEKCIAVAGLGAIGAPAVLEFARNQTGELRLLDFDIVEPATTVRWPLGITYSGWHKTAALKDFIGKHYPATVVNTFNHKVGMVMPLEYRKKGILSEQEILEQLFNGASLLFDATAEVGVNHFLSGEAKWRGIPYVCIYATHGAWGGLVMRVNPEKEQGCWMCLQHAKNDYDQNGHLINDYAIPFPVGDETDELQTAGCIDISFTGSAFDLQQVSLAGVRLAISTLCSKDEGGYLDMDWDVAILQLVDENQKPVAPIWRTYPLKVHPKCPYCNG